MRYEECFMTYSMLRYVPKVGVMYMYVQFETEMMIIV